MIDFDIARVGAESDRLLLGVHAVSHENVDVLLFEAYGHGVAEYVFTEVFG